MADRHLDALARRMGYHDFATYQAYQAKQQAMRLNNGIQGTGAPQGGPPPKNWLQSTLSSIPGHPAQLLGYVADRFSRATGGR